MITKRQQQLALQLAGGASQRWLNRKVRYRPPGEIFDPRFAEVAAIDESTAKEFAGGTTTLALTQRLASVLASSSRSRSAAKESAEAQFSRFR